MYIMSDTGYKIVDSFGNVIDIIGVFSTKSASTLADASNAYYSGGGTINVLNKFELYSSAGLGHPLQTNSIGYTIINKDICKYYTPVYYDISGAVNQTISIPSWAKKMAFVIQSKGGKNGTSVTGGKTFYANGTSGRGNPGGSQYYKIGGNITTILPAGVTFVFTRIIDPYAVAGKFYRTTPSYTGGSGLGGTCYVGTYTINTSNRATAVTYVSNAGTAGYLQFNDSLTCKVTVPNGTDGGNATTTANGTNATGSSSAATLSGSYIIGTSYSGSISGSGFNLNPSITTNYPIPTGVSFTNNGGPGEKEAHIIYWFLL